MAVHCLRRVNLGYLVHAMPPVVAVLLGFVAFLAALTLQFSRRRYLPWAYWLAVVMVGVFGTVAADVLHVGFGVPYIISTVLYGAALGGRVLHLAKDRAHPVDS